MTKPITAKVYIDHVTAKGLDLVVSVSHTGVFSYVAAPLSHDEMIHVVRSWLELLPAPCRSRIWEQITQAGELAPTCEVSS